MKGYFSYLLVSMLQLGLMAQATDLLGGHCGKLGFGAVLAAGVAGYAYAISTVVFAAPILWALLVALVAASLLGIVLSHTIVALHPDAYLLASFAFQMAFIEMMNNVDWSGGPLGLRQIPSSVFGGLAVEATTSSFLFLIISATVGLLVLVSGARRESGVARAHHWIRDDILSALASPLDTRSIMARACLVHCILGGAAGVGVVIAQGYVAPRTFDLGLSLKVLTVVVLSGVGGSPFLMLLGSAILVLVTELASFAFTAPEAVGPLQQVLVSSVLIGFLVFRRRGIGGPVLESGPSSELFE